MRNHQPIKEALVTDPYTGKVYDFGALFAYLQEQQMDQPHDISVCCERLSDQVPYLIDDNSQWILEMKNVHTMLIEMKRVFREIDTISIM